MRLAMLNHPQRRCFVTSGAKTVHWKSTIAITVEIQGNCPICVTFLKKMRSCVNRSFAYRFVFMCVQLWLCMVCVHLWMSCRCLIVYVNVLLPTLTNCLICLISNSSFNNLNFSWIKILICLTRECCVFYPIVCTLTQSTYSDIRLL